MKNLLLTLLLSPILVTASEEIFNEMDKETIVTTGIYKLSQSELTALTAWLNDSSNNNEKISREKIKKQVKTELIAENKENKIREEEIVRQEKKRNMGFRKEESERENIQSSIVGEFKGWQGKNIFKLENGQIWKQSERGNFYIPKRNDPKITIKPKSMGSWMLYVDGFGRGVKVKRIK